jgi:hypothetical protein
MVEEDKDESPQENTDETDEEVQDICLAFDDDLDSEVDDLTIQEDDCVFMMMVHLVDPHHFVHASSMVSRHLAEVFSKNKAKGVSGYCAGVITCICQHLQQNSLLLTARML